MKQSKRHYKDLIGVAQTFLRLDKDRSGTLTLQEFEVLFADRHAPGSPAAEMLFTILDRDGDGLVSWADLMATIGSRLSDGAVPLAMVRAALTLHVEVASFV